MGDQEVLYQQLAKKPNDWELRRVYCDAVLEESGGEETPWWKSQQWQIKNQKAPLATTVYEWVWSHQEALNLRGTERRGYWTLGYRVFGGIYAAHRTKTAVLSFTGYRAELPPTHDQCTAIYFKSLREAEEALSEALQSPLPEPPRRRTGGRSNRRGRIS